MIGRRLPDGTSGARFEPGDYGKVLAGDDDMHAGQTNWWTRPPVNERGISQLGRIATHTVVEHEDGTITVSPSILCDYGPDQGGWHGYLEKGVWRAC